MLGFKSFVEPAELIIRPGLTGIVGPNGCGKSNLLEALRWVMGETSYKAMRGGAMDDVIFAGTERRPARTSAEVTLTIDNSARKAPAEFNDSELIEIVRIIERGQGSRYRVNGREARAKDVKLLFEDAATGARSHALVRQGQIGEIVNAKPQARRRILEDAAGIAGLHTRRHEAELRLSAAEDNLERIGDLVGQMEAQLNSLKRQQRHADQYRALSAQLRQSEALSHYLQWQAAGAEVSKAENDLQTTLVRVAKETTRESEALSQRETLSETLKPLRLSEAQAAAWLERLSLERDHIAREEEQLQTRRADLNTQRGEAMADLARDRQLIDEGGDITQQLEADIARLSDHHTVIEAQCADLKKKAETVGGELTAQDAALDDIRTQAAHGEARRTSLVEEITRLEGRVEMISQRQNEIRLALEAFSSDEASTPGARLEDEIQVLEAELLTLKPQPNLIENQLVKARAQTEAARAQVTDNALALKALQTEIDTIEALLRGGGDEGHPPLLMEITTEAGYEKALWAALGDDLDMPRLETPPSGGAVSAYWRTLTAPDTSVGLPEDAQPIRSFVKGPDVLMQSLALVGLVRDEDGPRLQSALKPGQKLVSAEGGLWRWDGFVSLPGGPSSSPRRLLERNRLPALLTQRDDLNDQNEQARLSLEAALIAEQAEVSSLEAVRAQLSRVQDKLNTLYHQQGEAAAAARSRIAQEEGLRSGLEQSSNELEEISLLLSERQQALADLPVHDKLIEARDQQVELVNKLREAHGKLSLEHASLDNEGNMTCQRLEEQRAELARWQSRTGEAEAHIVSLEKRLIKINSELESLAQAPEEFAARRSQLMDEVVKAEGARADAADRLAEGETALQAAETVLSRVQKEVMEARETKARVETRLEAARASLISIVATIEAKLDVKPDGALLLAGLSAEDELPPLADVEDDIKRYKTERDRLGAVNLRAGEEIAALDGQFGAMIRERDDLSHAVAQLHSAINQLNEEGRQRLMGAFEVVNGHFKRLFQTLFAGGEAALQLIESDDPLEAGLEIIARPPGKKPQVLTLLSGGEKALTAMSLIFAVFLTNPSPICVLDEVDAPLDDSNVERFCGMLDNMAAETETRFLVITHHPMTMERMDRLFGVTMSEKGVSQLVSVDLATAEKLRETG